MGVIAALVNPEMLTEDITTPATVSDNAHNWGESAPKGGRAVMQRILKEGTKVPLFLGQRQATR